MSVRRKIYAALLLIIMSMIAMAMGAHFHDLGDRTISVMICWTIMVVVGTTGFLLLVSISDDLAGPPA